MKWPGVAPSDQTREQPARSAIDARRNIGLGPVAQESAGPRLAEERSLPLAGSAAVNHLLRADI
jgi:hypothetical protein